MLDFVQTLVCGRDGDSAGVKLLRFISQGKFLLEFREGGRGDAAAPCVCGCVAGYSLV